jgi:CRP/FNR family cyclic AMP-dependent transcriptional regulator
MQKVKFNEGETIFSEGEPSANCFKILSGQVKILLNIPGVINKGRSKTIATCGVGEIIGEMSVIDKGERSATAVAIEPTLCMSYTADEIIGLLEDDPQEALAYVRTLIKRVRSSNRKISWSASHHN